MIFITGDIHGKVNLKSLRQEINNYYKEKLTIKDYLIICGDFGCIWTYSKDKNYDLYKDLLSAPWTTLFVDGNHENHSMLNQYPITMWKSGKVHIIEPNKIIHLMRGQVFDIDNNKIFTMGGASSIDKSIRSSYIDWWPEELPSAAEYEEALANLAKYNYKVDYVISHCVPFLSLEEIFDKWVFKNDSDELVMFFQSIQSNIEYKHWYCGHYHINKDLKNNITVLYKNVIPIGENVKFIDNFRKI